MPKANAGSFPLALSEFHIIRKHYDCDLRTIRWRADILRELVRKYRLKDHEAHVFINATRLRSRWLVVWRETPFLIMAPVGHKLEYEASMTIAADFANTEQLRDEFLAEISELE